MRKDFIQQRFRRKNQEGTIGGGRNGGGKEEFTGSDQQQQFLQLAAAASAMNLAAALENQQQQETTGMIGNFNSTEKGVESPQAQIVTSTDATAGDKMSSTTAAEAFLQTHLLNGLLE